MNHQLINTGAGWRCLRCKVAWDQGDDAPETCDAADDYGFVTDLPSASQSVPPGTWVEGFAPIYIGPKGVAAGIPVVTYTPPGISEADAYRLGASVTVGAKSFPKAEALQGQVGGDWYKTLAIQPTEFCMRNGLDAAIHGTLKYLTRWRQKDGLKDLKKGRHFIEIREAFPLDIHPPRQIAITMLQYVTLNRILPEDAEALYRLEAYYNAVAPTRPGECNAQRVGAYRLKTEIDNLISRAA